MSFFERRRQATARIAIVSLVRVSSLVPANMDVQCRNKGGGEVKCDEQSQVLTKSVKRPFDVAFLMLPDEKLKQKQTKLAKSASFDKDVDSCYNNNEENEDEDVEIEDSPCELKLNRQSYFTQKQQIFDDPNLIKNKNYQALRKAASPVEQKSAFTKVNLNKESRVSPSLSLSPDTNYQNSLSPSPPIINRQYQNFPANMLPQNQLFKASPPLSAYHTNFLPENFQHHPAIDAHFLAKNSGELIHPNFPKMRPTMYRPEFSYNYQQFQGQELLKIASPSELKFSQEIRHPAAAILTSLLPPSLAALSLPGQNVCAKCNITFRMTSDLVYHMRSHHKNETNDMNRRRREEKLKCPVCAESFRERHHLTRHMTAHQDKDDDDKETKKDGL
ncbi:hypothetical protein HUJ04_002589 [Dendroctonus ponderosae]|nr:hypothetical protein HUJ04_002589 [Dendroctonus ponderosae]